MKKIMLRVAVLLSIGVFLLNGCDQKNEFIDKQPLPQNDSRLSPKDPLVGPKISPLNPKIIRIRPNADCNNNTPCPAGWICVNGGCVNPNGGGGDPIGCIGPCGGFYYSSYSTPNSYYVYPIQSTIVDCAAARTVIIDFKSLDVPNRFVVRDPSNVQVASTGWLGQANYGGPWGSSLNNNGSALISFSKTATTYYIEVQTKTPTSNINPSTDRWEVRVSCSTQ